MRFNDLVKKLLEADAPPPPPPPAIVHKAPQTFSYQEIYELIKDHEGYKNNVYKDSLGKPTIGIGFNLTRPDARNIIQQIGGNYDKILSGETSLSDKQVKDLFEITISIAYKDAQKYLPNLMNMPKNIKLAIIDMAFNMGYPRLSQFKNTKEYIISGNYNKAAEEILNSKWAKQVKRRAANISKLIVTA
jgi:GH24 family phage-related lysozyme (muramidase)